jgi:DNA-binding CsgD family transcriptional regulator
MIIGGLTFFNWKRKRQMEDKEEELETLRQLITESQQHTEQKDDRFFKRILLQQLGVIRMAASNPTNANQELIRRMSEIVDGQVPVDSLLNWEDLYQTIDYIYEGFYTRIKEKYGEILNEKELQLCCLLRANFSTKEISIVSGQGVRTVYQRKSVIRQKLNMEEKADIIEYLS